MCTELLNWGGGGALIRQGTDGSLWGQLQPKCRTPPSPLEYTLYTRLCLRIIFWGINLSNSFLTKSSRKRLNVILFSLQRYFCRKVSKIWTNFYIKSYFRAKGCDTEIEFRPIVVSWLNEPCFCSLPPPPTSKHTHSTPPFLSTPLRELSLSLSEQKGGMTFVKFTGRPQFEGTLHTHTRLHSQTNNTYTDSSLGKTSHRLSPLPFPLSNSFYFLDHIFAAKNFVFLFLNKLHSEKRIWQKKLDFPSKKKNAQTWIIFLNNSLVLPPDTILKQWEDNKKLVASPWKKFIFTFFA